MSAGFPVLEDFIKGLLPRNSVVESWTVANPFLFLGVLAYSLDRVSFHTDLLESIDLLLSILRNFHCFFFPLPLDFLLAAVAPEVSFSKLSFFTRRENASHEFVFQVSDRDLFQVWCSLLIHLF